MALVPISVFVPEELLDELEKARHDARVSRSDWLRSAIREKLLADGYNWQAGEPQ